MEHSTASSSRILHPQLKGRYLWKRAQRLPNNAHSHSTNHRTQTCTPCKWNCKGNSEGKNVINQTEIFVGISCGVYSEFHLKDRTGWHIFPHSKLHLATEFCITGTTSGDICPPFPALTLASRLVKQTCQLGSSNCRIHFSPDHTNLFDFATKQRRSAPLFPHRWQFRDASWLTDQSVAGRGNSNARSQVVPPTSAQDTLPGNGSMATECNTGITSNSSLQSTSGGKICTVHKRMNLRLIPNLYPNTPNKD